MEKTNAAALDALELIKETAISHVKRDVVYDCDGNPIYSYHEECDGTIEDNYPEEIKEIEKALFVFEIIRSHFHGMGGIKGTPEGPNECVISLKDLTPRECSILKEALK